MTTRPTDSTKIPPVSHGVKVICPGFGRTGTSSTYTALNMVGYRAHHMVNVFMDRSAVSFEEAWEAKKKGEKVDVKKLFQGYDAVTDFPGCMFYKELMETFPDAKVVLTYRDPEKWYQSCIDTIYQMTHLRSGFPSMIGIAIASAIMGPQPRMATNMIFRDYFQNRFEDKEFTIKIYNEWVAEVKRYVPPERLLVYEVREGWGPLCKFLDKPVPEEPFPNVNDTKAMQKRFTAIKAFSWFILFLPIACSGTLYYFFK